ncbi:MAG TPA: methyltransferase domain-containing protein [Rhodanobacteraceae bacterium]|nr:methyltransferase domain-containing protein [Rhodanobacteraceae bacterium]
MSNDAGSLALPCAHYRNGDCRSCNLLPQPYATQLADKAARCRALLSRHADLRWLPAQASPVGAFRNKAKMAVAGSMDAPTLGLADATGFSTDLRDCPLYPADMQQALDTLAEFVSRAKLPPYDIPQRQGELKFLLLTRAAGSGEFLLRFVLRSREAIQRIDKQLPWLRQQLPALRVASANLLPEHKAALEGTIELPFAGPGQLELRINERTLRLGPRCFWQTNDAIAAALYRQARDWCEDIDPGSVWDLYCGIGGFALHLANGRRAISGIELATEAIACAQTAGAGLGDERLQFHAADATAFAESHRDAPDLLVVNPPRRGLGERLCRWIDTSPSRWLIYSSCNAETLAADLARLPRWQARQARVFDMFPHSHHFEAAVLLQRAAA